MEATTPSTVGQLNAQLRPEHGKSANRKLVRTGKIPGICYGKGVAPVAVSIDPKELVRALDPEKRTNTLIKMKLSGGAPNGKSEELTVMLREWQTDVLRGNVTHADFVRVSVDHEVHATVPIVLTGKSEGVKLGGILHTVYRALAIACTPDKIPTKIEISIDKLGVGDALHVRDLVLPKGVRALLDGGAAICSITVPKAEKVVEAVVAEAAEGAAAAPAAAGKEGDKAAPAAAAGKDAKKEGGDKKK
jgi:large subunit ribosomal protein L25